MEKEILHLFVPSLSLQVTVGNRQKFLDGAFALANEDRPASRVLAASPRASREGVRRGMTLSDARRRSKKLAVKTHQPGLSAKAGRELYAALMNWSPLVEPVGGGFFVDLTGTGKLFGPPADAAGKVMREFDSRFGLVTSSGIGSCKLVGRAASSVAGTGGLAQVMHSGEADFLGGFPLARVLWAERTLLSRLVELGFSKVAHLQGLSGDELVSAFGKDGRRLYNLARGIDLSPVVPAESVPELDLGETLSESTNDRDILRQVLWSLSAELGAKLRERGTAAGSVRLLVVFRDGKRTVRNASMRPPARFDGDIFEKCCRLFTGVLYRRVQVSYLGLRASRLSASSQPDLFGEFVKKEGLYAALDEVRQRYGKGALLYGAGPWQG